MLGRMLRTRSATTAALVLVLVVLIVGAVHLVREYRQRPYRELRAAAHAIQLSVERFAVDVEGNYPHRMEDLQRRGYVKEWPDNPFGPGRMKPLKPGDPWEPGGFVYVGSGPIIYTSEEAYEQRPNIPTEIDQYVLVFYSPRVHSARAAAAMEERGKFVGYGEPLIEHLGNKHHVQASVLATEGIDWEHAEVVLTAGEEHVEP